MQIGLRSENTEQQLPRQQTQVVAQIQRPCNILTENKSQ